MNVIPLKYRSREPVVKWRPFQYTTDRPRSEWLVQQARELVRIDAGRVRRTQRGLPIEDPTVARGAQGRRGKGHLAADDAGNGNRRVVEDFNVAFRATPRGNGSLGADQRALSRPPELLQEGLGGVRTFEEKERMVRARQKGAADGLQGQ